MLRNLTPQDAQAVQGWLDVYLQQHIAWWEAAYQTQARSNLQELVQRDWNDLLADSSKPDRLVLVAGEQPQGIVWGRISQDPFLEVPVGVLSWIYVDPTARGQGLADQLVEGLLQWFRDQGAQGRQVYVTASNPAAVKLYQRQGFQVVDHRMLGPI